MHHHEFRQALLKIHTCALNRWLLTNSSERDVWQDDCFRQNGCGSNERLPITRWGFSEHGESGEQNSDAFNKGTECKVNAATKGRKREREREREKEREREREREEMDDTGSPEPASLGA
jgi:hypothetical protein